MNTSRRMTLLFLTGLAMLFVFQGVTAVTQTDTKISSANAIIAQQQALIAKYQTMMAGAAANSSKAQSYTLYINKANQVISAQQALILQLQKSQSVSSTSPLPASPPVLTESSGIQNISNYHLILTHVTVLNTTCNPACVPMAELLPNQVQAYSFTTPSGYIVFDYDVQDQSKNIGHLSMTATPTGVVLNNGLGGTITKGTQNYQLGFIPPVPYWRGEFTNLNNWAVNNWNVSQTLPTWGLQNIEVMASKAGQLSPRGDNYLRIHYPAGSANYRSGPPVGGVQFYGALLNTVSPVTLSFYMMLPTNFPLTSSLRGSTVGKLPGLYGGIGNTGTNLPTGLDGWTTRFMWCDYNKGSGQKMAGGGQLLQFTPGSNLGTFGTVEGTFLACGVWKFLADGKWHNVQQTIHLNTVGQTNGQIDICVDGVPVFTQKNIQFRTGPSLQTNGILFQTFFGGGDKSFATPINTYADFADFALYLYPDTAPSGLCVTSP